MESIDSVVTVNFVWSWNWTAMSPTNATKTKMKTFQVVTRFVLSFLPLLTLAGPIGRSQTINESAPRNAIDAVFFEKVKRWSSKLRLTIFRRKMWFCNRSQPTICSPHFPCPITANLSMGEWSTTFRWHFSWKCFTRITEFTVRATACADDKLINYTVASKSSFSGQQFPMLEVTAICWIDFEGSGHG